MGQIAEACDAAEDEADFRGENFGPGIHHCRLDLRDAEDGLADSAIGAVGRIEKSAYEKINAENEQNPLLRSKQEDKH